MAKVLSSSKLLDDKGREFPTARISGTQVWDGRDVAADLPNELAEACVAAVNEFSPAQWPAWPWLALGGCGWVGIVWLTGARSGADLVGPLIFPAVLLTTMYWRRRSSERRPYDDRVLATLLAADRCPSCGYSLSVARVGSDGTKTCSECGAGWLVPDLRQLPQRRPGVIDSIVPESDLPVSQRLSYADGRGRAVWLTDPACGIVPVAWGQLGVAKQNRLLDRSRARGRVERVGWMCWAGFSFGFAGLQFVRALNPAHVWAGVLGVVFTVLGTLAVVKILRYRTARSGEAIATVFLVEWVCPSCCAEFVDPREEPDGCVTCTTCHAAWRVKGAVGESPGMV